MLKTIPNYILVRLFSGSHIKALTARVHAINVVLRFVTALILVILKTRSISCMGKRHSA